LQDIPHEQEDNPVDIAVQGSYAEAMTRIQTVCGPNPPGLREAMQ